MTRRFQFSLRALLVLMLTVACFFGGVAWQRYKDRPLSIEVRATYTRNGKPVVTQALQLGDGTEWFRTVEAKDGDP